MKTIKAAVCRQFGKPLTIEDVQLREPLAGEVGVKLTAAAICHSDISFADGYWGGDLPAVYGHEAAGIIETIGEGVSGFAVGDSVIVTLIRSCGNCISCASNMPVVCSAEKIAGSPIMTMDGNSIVQAMNCGAFAQSVVVDQSQIAAIPPDMPKDVASLLSCGVITGVGAVVNSAALRPGQTAVIIGAGGVGLNAIQGARIAGAARVIAVDLVAGKLEAAMEYGATDTINAKTEDVAGRIREITKGRMADAVLVTVGVPAAYEDAPRYLAVGGKMIMVGMTRSGDHVSYEPVNFAAYGQQMIGSKMGDVVLRRDIPWLIDLYSQGRLKLDSLISRHWRLDQINEAIEDTRSGNARRNVIVFDETH